MSIRKILPGKDVLSVARYFNVAWIGLLFVLSTIVVQAQEVSTTLIGRLYCDGTSFVQGEAPLRNSVGISDLRLGVKLNYGKFDIMTDLSFANSTVSMKDVYGRYYFTPSSYVRTGHFEEPMGLDIMESSGNIKFMNAPATVQALASGRKLGIQYVGWNKSVWYSAGVFGNSVVNLNPSSGNSGYSTAGRLVFNPLRETGRIIHLGAAMVYRRADPVGYAVADDANHSVGDDLPRKFKFTSTGNVVSNAAGDFLSCTVDNARNQIKSSAEIVAVYGPVGFQGEYIATRVNRTGSLKAYNASGVYGQVAWLALGGDYSYSTGWARLNKPTPGALEVVVRYNNTKLNDTEADVLGGEMNDLSVAVNYYFNKYVTFRLNYSTIRLDDNAALKGLKTGKAINNVNVVAARIQVVF